MEDTEILGINRHERREDAIKFWRVEENSVEKLGKLIKNFKSFLKKIFIHVRSL